jgi:hypothetical protein
VTTKDEALTLSPDYVVMDKDGDTMIIIMAANKLAARWQSGSLTGATRTISSQTPGQLYLPWTIKATPSSMARKVWKIGDEVLGLYEAVTLPDGTELKDKDNDLVIVTTIGGAKYGKWSNFKKNLESPTAASEALYFPWEVTSLPGVAAPAPAPAPAAPVVAPAAVPAVGAGLPPDAPPVPLTVSLKPVWTEEVDTVAMRLTKVAEKPGGGNPGGVYQDTQTGRKYLVKHMSLEAVVVEVLTAALYRAGGVCAPDVRYASVGNKGISTISPWEAAIGKLSPPLTQSQKYHVREGMAFDMWLSNWDVAGLLMDNIVQVPAYPTNNPCSVMRIDVGGSLFLRANGGDKPTSGPKGYNEDYPTEMATFLDGTNPTTKKLFVEWSNVSPESWWKPISSKQAIRRITALCSTHDARGVPVERIIDWAIGSFSLPRIAALKTPLVLRAAVFAGKVLSDATEQQKQDFSIKVKQLFPTPELTPSAPPPMTAPVDPAPHTAPVATPQPVTNDLPMPGSVWWFNRSYWAVWQETSSSTPVFVKVSSDGSYSTTALSLSDAPANAKKLFARPAGESGLYIWPKASLKSAIAANAQSAMKSTFTPGAFALGQEVTAKVFNQAPQGTMIQALQSPVSYIRQADGRWLSVAGEMLTREELKTAYQSQDPAKTYKITGIAGVTITDVLPTAVVEGTAALLAALVQQ